MKTRCPQCRVNVEAPDNWTEQGGFRCPNCGRTNRPPKPKAEDIPPPTSEFDPKRRASEQIDEPRGGGIGDYLAFRKMIIPVVIQIIFWFLVLVVIGGGLVFGIISLTSGKTETMLIGLAGVFIGVPLYLLLTRMYCELVIVVFRMNDTLTDIRNLLDRRNRY